MIVNLSSHPDPDTADNHLIEECWIGSVLCERLQQVCDLSPKTRWQLSRSAVSCVKWRVMVHI